MKLDATIGEIVMEGWSVLWQRGVSGACKARVMAERAGDGTTERRFAFWDGTDKGRELALDQLMELFGR